MRAAQRAYAQLFSLILLATLFVGPVFAQATSDLEGAWKVVEWWGHNPRDGEWRVDNVQPSIYLFAGGHYAITSVNSDEPRPQIPEGKSRSTLTAEEAIAIWGPYTSNSGTFEVSGSTLTVRPIVALSPGFMTGDASASYDYRIENGRLILSRSGDDWSSIAALERY